ncbi:MAG: response regulator transcription factor [Dehalococcoidales bacterium]|nr:response regulator transcription factor [Dehalococcoidales bacterium]MDX9985842.1 response regulator transcription factor [Dehalococcoidales bacterium]
MKTIRVMIIDEQPFFRAGVRLALESQSDFKVLDADPSDDTLNSIDLFQPDIVLLGSDLANFSGLELGTRIARRYPNTKVIMLSPDPNDQELFKVIRSSAVACLKKTVPPEELISNIRSASRGEYPINDNEVSRPIIVRQVLNNFQDMETLSRNVEEAVAPLTNREREILGHIADGNSNKQIARILNISEQTIKNHVSAIMRKLNANDRAHAVVLAIRRGLIKIEENHKRPEY